MQRWNGKWESLGEARMKNTKWSWGGSDQMEVEVAVVVRATKLAKKRGSRRRQRRGCQVQRRRRARGGTRQFGGVSLGLLLSRAAALAQAATEGGGRGGG